jgi:hypothetical protein
MRDTPPNNADAPNAAMALSRHCEHHRRGVGDGIRFWAGRLAVLSKWSPIEQHKLCFMNATMSPPVS